MTKHPFSTMPIEQKVIVNFKHFDQKVASFPHAPHFYYILLIFQSRALGWRKFVLLLIIGLGLKLIFGPLCAEVSRNFF